LRRATTIHTLRTKTQTPRTNTYTPRTKTHTPRTKTHTPRTKTHTPRIITHTPRTITHGIGGSGEYCDDSDAQLDRIDVFYHEVSSGKYDAGSLVNHSRGQKLGQRPQQKG
jgi:hypothetical protein